MTKNNSIPEILDELEMNEAEKRIFMSSIRETKHAQLDDSIDAKNEILEMIKEEFKS